MLTAFDLKTLEHGYESGSSASKPVRSHHMTSQWNVIVSCEQSKKKKKKEVICPDSLFTRHSFEIRTKKSQEDV